MNKKVKQFPVEYTGIPWNEWGLISLVLLFNHISGITASIIGGIAIVWLVRTVHARGYTDGRNASAYPDNR